MPEHNRSAPEGQCATGGFGVTHFRLPFDAVVFDFAPQVEIGAEILSRRGEDQRLITDRPAAQRRRVKDAEYHAARAAERDAEQHTRLATEGFGDDGDE